MDRDGIDVSLCSIVPSLFLYDAEPGETLRAHRVINDAGAAYAERSGGRVAVLATVPLNDPAAAADELHRACGELGLVGVEMGPSVGETMVDSDALDPVFAAAEELDVTVMLHPYLNMVAQPGPDLEGFHLPNVVGNPYETFVAAARLIVGGVFDRHPGLRVQLAHAGRVPPTSSGGSSTPIARARRRGRWHGADPLLPRPLPVRHGHLRRARAGLPDRARGSGCGAHGTDLPFDMADVSALEALPRIASDEVVAKVLGTNALRAYGVAEPAPRS